MLGPWVALNFYLEFLFSRAFALIAIAFPKFGSPGCYNWQKSEQGHWSRTRDTNLVFFFHGDNRVIEWFKKSIVKLDKCTDVKVKKCMK